MSDTTRDEARCGCGGKLVASVVYYDEVYQGLIACDQCGVEVHPDPEDENDTEIAAIAAAWAAYWGALGWRKPEEVPEAGRKLLVGYLAGDVDLYRGLSAREIEAWPAEFAPVLRCWFYVDPPPWGKTETRKENERDE